MNALNRYPCLRTCVTYVSGLYSLRERGFTFLVTNYVGAAFGREPVAALPIRGQRPVLQFHTVM